MTRCLFVSDLHGSLRKYDRLFRHIAETRPQLVFFGGDLLPGGTLLTADLFRGAFVERFLGPRCRELKLTLKRQYPKFLLIPGNDDPRLVEEDFLRGESEGLWHYLHLRTIHYRQIRISGCAFVPPSPFRLKDWERYDVSHYVDPGCVAPEEGMLSLPIPPNELSYTTITESLETLSEGKSGGVYLFHAPPYDTGLDRADLNYSHIDGVPLDVHVGSIAIRRFIEKHRPRITLHGHIHESFRLTGVWKQQLGSTWCLSAADDASALTVVEFELKSPGKAIRQCLK